MSVKPLQIGVMLGVGEDPGESLARVEALGLSCAQLGRPPDPYLHGEGRERVKEALEAGGVAITTVFCGYDGESYADIPTVRRTVGFVPRETRTARLAKTREIADFAHYIGTDAIAAHIGFIPEEAGDADYQAVVSMTREVCQYCSQYGMTFALETGQETAEVLRRFIEDVDHPLLKVNFDPANMILYGSGEPLPALRTVADWVSSVHCKDARWPTRQGEFGTETPLGEGDVDMEAFVESLEEIGYRGPLTIEREIMASTSDEELSVEQQYQDILAGIELLEELGGVR